MKAIDNLKSMKVSSLREKCFTKCFVAKAGKSWMPLVVVAETPKQFICLEAHTKQVMTCEEPDRMTAVDMPMPVPTCCMSNTWLEDPYVKDMNPSGHVFCISKQAELRTCTPEVTWDPTR